jgi:hypothetical protein
LASRLLSKNVKIKIHKNFASPIILYGCETWSLRVREEHKLNVCENRVLRRIFGPKGDEVKGGWRKLYNEELAKGNACGILVGIPEGKGSL